MTKADEQYRKLMERVVAAGSPPSTRKFWRAVVKSNGRTVEWHSAACDAPRNECHGCEPE